jgi:2-deoxy-D-gluconate 3-dehydrogenase
MNFNITDFSMDYFRLDGKVALVTGGNTGLGKGYAIALAKAGADLFVVTYDDDWKETRELITAEGRRAEFFQSDLSVRENITKLVNTCMDLLGRIDILVNNAGTIRIAPLLDFKDEDWQAVLDVNLNAVYYLSHEVAKIMADQGGGKIINVGSMYSFLGGKMAPSYTASRHGVVGITKAFADELAVNNIQVNAVAPGFILTAGSAFLLEGNKEILARIPTGRLGYPYDCMGAIVFLASKASDYITGCILPIDGGYLVD